jgi:hypothetical protein
VREVCEAQGTDYTGRVMIFSGRAADRWSAEAEALRRCEWDRNVRSCFILNCRAESQSISRRPCR